MEFLFEVDGKKVVLRGMSNGGPKEISAQRMEAILRHDDIVWAAQCLISTKLMKGQHTNYQDDELHTTLDKHSTVFFNIPPGIPPHRGFEHTIELEEGAKPIITKPYHHPKMFKDEIEKMIQEFLEKRWIRPSSSPFASSIILVKKKDGTL